MNSTLQNILKCLENNRERKGIKSGNLPISTHAQMEIFQNIGHDEFQKLVNYLKYIGGFNLKEAVHLCFKEAMTDDITRSFTWWGRQDNSRPLYNTRIVIAIYEAVCGNRHFSKPTRAEFQAQMREAIRTAKQRCRNRTRGPLGPNLRERNFWTEEPQDLPAAEDSDE
ncbi:uncharacterized protein LOC116853509 [Odontomachus brunneus]|uniref:uncharacterized protein LOC116853509 n=1 Tax=Odontomachus brunneus TaxID=486640 RepID=UPI0013F1C776|nr:uncharacterized protein LOC116853509 [Odontomachus brunneus]